MLLYHVCPPPTSLFVRKIFTFRELFGEYVLLHAEAWQAWIFLRQNKAKKEKFYFNTRSKKAGSAFASPAFKYHVIILLKRII